MHLDKIIIVFCFWMFLVFFDSARKDKYLWDNFHFMCVYCFMMLVTYASIALADLKNVFDIQQITLIDPE